MLRRRMMMQMAQEVEEEMGWKEVKTVVVQNDGDVLYVDGFEAERIRITAMLAATEDNKGLRFNISEDLYASAFNLGMSITTNLNPITFELGVVGNCAISTAFCTPKNYISANAQSAYAGGMTLPNGETLLKRFRINSANGKLKIGSWMKIEKWR